MNLKIAVSFLAVLMLLVMALAMGVLNRQTERVLNVTESALIERTSAIAKTTVEQVRADLLSGRHRDAALSLERLRASDLISGFRLLPEESQSEGFRSVSNASQAEAGDIRVERVPVVFNEAQDDMRWGEVELQFSTTAVREMSETLSYNHRLFTSLLLGLVVLLGLVIVAVSLWLDRRILTVVQRLFVERRDLEASDGVLLSRLVPRLVEVSNQVKRHEDELERWSSQEARIEMGRRLTHDMKSPLSLLRVLSDQPDVGDGAERSEMLRRVADRFENLADELLNLGRQTDSVEKVTLAEIHTRIQELIAEKRREWSSSGWETQIMLMSEVDRSELVVASPSLGTGLPRVVSNLLNNAKEAMGGQGQIEVQLGLETDQSGRRALTMHFVDRGPGVSAQLRSRLFQPGVSSRSGSGGHGLGLSNSKALVEQADGSLELSSTGPQGSVFTVRLFEVRLKG
jgi:hypothetical protein